MTQSLQSLELAVPPCFLCPITHEIMRDPLMSRSGHSFERQAILTWLVEHNHTCPLTRQPLNASALIPNRALQMRIEAWCVQNDVPVQETATNKTAAPNLENILITCLVSKLEQQRQVNASKPDAVQQTKKRRNILSFAGNRAVFRGSSD